MDRMRVRQRQFLIMCLITLLLIGGIFRLFTIQVWNRHHYSAAGINLVERSVKQRMQAIVLDDGRGHFVDREQRPLTGHRIQVLAVFPDMVSESASDGASADHGRLADVLQVPRSYWEEWLETRDGPSLWTKAGKEPEALTEAQAKQIAGLGLSGVEVVPYERRYPPSYLASHVIGFRAEYPEQVRRLYADQLASGKLGIDNRIGVSGLEKTFDFLLHGQAASTIFQYVDARMRPYRDSALHRHVPEHRHYPLHIETTLDSPIQAAIERIVDESRLETGAVVLLDARTADIVSMVSRPDFSPDQVDPNQENWRNRAVKAAIPGSVFKTVTAAAVLEQGGNTNRQTYHCSGDLGRYRFVCWKPGGHGRLTLAEAYAQSCNISFAQAALSLPAGKLEETAAKFGLTEPIGWSGRAFGDREMFRQLDGEEAGQLFAAKSELNDAGMIAQTAIGQRDVRLSPLAAANMVVTILHGGEVRQPRIVSNIRYADGSIMQSFPVKRVHSHAGAISARTAATLRDWMRRTVTEGTGRSLADATWKLAGKSGTAQLPSDDDDSQLYNEWFVGYGPADAPRYALAVMVEQTDGRGEHVATRLFGRIMDELAAIEAGRGQHQHIKTYSKIIKRMI